MVLVVSCDVLALAGHACGQVAGCRHSLPLSLLHRWPYPSCTPGLAVECWRMLLSWQTGMIQAGVDLHACLHASSPAACGGLLACIPGRSSCCAHAGGRKWATQRDALRAGVDVVVGTPGRLVTLLSSGALDLSACQTLVLDEADVLLGDAAAFSEQACAGWCCTDPTLLCAASAVDAHCLQHCAWSWSAGSRCTCAQHALSPAGMLCNAIAC